MPVPIDDPLEQRPPAASAASPPPRADDHSNRVRESGGPPGPDPTRYGDWELRGHCIDF
ncbi:MAG TPA: DUF1674 domain-containing protein [Steroidobacteraceae bacterium]|nr:DUF1674 domain-containing protein [Steroidobacteraceae bacterium]